MKIDKLVFLLLAGAFAFGTLFAATIVSEYFLNLFQLLPVSYQKSIRPILALLSAISVALALYRWQRNGGRENGEATSGV